MSWHANVANNPNINHDPVPAPLDVVHGAPATAPAHQAPAAHPDPAAQVVVQHSAPAPVYGPPVPIGIGLGMHPPPPFGFIDPFLHLHGGGPLAPIHSGSFLPGAHGGIGFGIHGAAGVAFPPPPPGALAGGVVAPFAPTTPLWAPGTGLAFGNVPINGVGGIGVGVGMGGFLPPFGRPAPFAVDGNSGAPAQPKQQDVTQIPGGIPPGATHVESPEHTLVIQLKGNMCPWLSPGVQFMTEMLHIATGTGLNRLITVLNNNQDAKNMAVTECIELGNGLWEKGQTFKFDDAVSRVLTMKDAGWDNKRNRTGGQSLHVWLHRI